MKKILFVVDGNFYLHRAWHVMHTNNDIGNALSYLFMSMVCKDAVAVRATHLLVAFDGASFRYKVYDGYKEKRKKNGKSKSSQDEGAKEIYTYLPQVQNYLSSGNIQWIQPAKYEADDVGATAAQLACKDLRVVIGTKDKDSYQFLSDLVSLYNSSAKPTPQYIRVRDAEKAKGVNIAQMIDYQTLLGDSGDSIPGFKGYGPAKVKDIITKYKTIKNWFKKGSKEDKDWLIQHQDALVRNRKLVKLVTDCVDIDVDTLKVPKVKDKNSRMPKAWHNYQAFLYPKSRGLF